MIFGKHSKLFASMTSNSIPANVCLEYYQESFQTLWCHNDAQANPDKIQAILKMTPPKSIKEVQSLNGRLAAFNRFVSRAMDKCLPFFKMLKKAFKWTDECQKAFEKLKTYLASPLLSPSNPVEELSLYLVVSLTAVSQPLFKKRTAYSYLSTTLAVHFKGQKEDTSYGKRLAFALVMATRKLRPYFQAHTTVVQTGKLLQREMNNSKAVGRSV